jgi:hypothetical protein
LIFQAALRGVLYLEFLLTAVQQLLSFAAFATPPIVQPRFEIPRLTPVNFWNQAGARNIKGAHFAVGDRISDMQGWFERWQKRRRELVEDADADLMQSNRRRFRVAFGLIGLALVMGLVDAKFLLPATLAIIFRVGAGTSVVVGIVLAKWAQHEHAFLTRPDPEGPPEIFKNSSG